MISGAGIGEDVDLAMLGLRLFARYDSLRLATYQARERQSAVIRTVSMGAATALRFDDVGYFNRIYAPDDSLAASLAHVEAFYRGCPFPCELIGPVRGCGSRIDRICRGRGWKPGSPYAWLYGRMPLASRFPAANGFTIRPPLAGERISFLHCYLRAFEAQPDRVPAAVRNMRHLFERPELSFLMACQAGRPVAIGMLYREQRTAGLCAGATLPEYRREGCHGALLAARIRLAIRLGCDEIFSWAIAGGQSHANMEAAGLRTLGITRAWRFFPPPQHRPR